MKCTLPHQSSPAKRTKALSWAPNSAHRSAQMAALSLVCNDCGALLRSVKEAQDHGEATGHASFSESTEAVGALISRFPLCCCDRAACSRRKSTSWALQVKRYVCKECGKPCRSDTERDVHTRRTGHAEFEDKVGSMGGWAG